MSKQTTDYLFLCDAQKERDKILKKIYKLALFKTSGCLLFSMRTSIVLHITALKIATVETVDTGPKFSSKSGWLIEASPNGT